MNKRGSRRGNFTLILTYSDMSSTASGKDGRGLTDVLQLAAETQTGCFSVFGQNRIFYEYTPAYSDSRRLSTYKV
jgi:hypothetical protein